MWFLVATMYWQFWMSCWANWIRSAKTDLNETPADSIAAIKKIWFGNGTFKEKSAATTELIESILARLPVPENSKGEIKNFLFTVAEQIENFNRCTETCDMSYA